ncbi:MAG: hypothetical protein WCS27_01690 [Victivallaceae bacterium]
MSRADHKKTESIFPKAGGLLEREKGLYQKVLPFTLRQIRIFQEFPNGSALKIPSIP